MTVAYSSTIATIKYWTFLRLLLKWKGSVYRLIWFEFFIFLALYTILSLTYRFLLDDEKRIYFEVLCVYCNTYSETIPVAFVVGFYVSLVVNRWWDQFMSLPWPDRVAMFLTAYCHGNGERPTRIRRTIVRYVNLAYCIALRAISSRARFRFPTLDHLVSAGLMTQDELDIYLNTQPCEYTLYHVPLVWAMNVVTQARQERYIPYDRAVEILSEEITAFRGKLGTIFGYDWVNPPLVYTQMTTIAVYAYFTTCLFSWQYLDPSKGYKNYEVDIYIPIFGILRFFFYMGWLKVAESLINPFGEDVDDFEIEYLIERNLHVSYLIVDGMHHEHPDTTDIILPDFSVKELDASSQLDLYASNVNDRFIGSLANLDLNDLKPNVPFWRSSVMSRKLSTASMRKSNQPV